MTQPRVTSDWHEGHARTHKPLSTAQLFLGALGKRLVTHYPLIAVSCSLVDTPMNVLAFYKAHNPATYGNAPWGRRDGGTVRAQTRGGRQMIFLAVRFCCQPNFANVPKI
jgi:hypothetical protein